MGQASAEQALRALELLVGEWTLEAKGPDGRAWPGEGRDQCLKACRIFWISSGGCVCG